MRGESLPLHCSQEGKARKGWGAEFYLATEGVSVLWYFSIFYQIDFIDDEFPDELEDEDEEDVDEDDEDDEDDGEDGVAEGVNAVDDEDDDDDDEAELGEEGDLGEDGEDDDDDDEEDFGDEDENEPGLDMLQKDNLSVSSMDSEDF